MVINPIKKVMRRRPPSYQAQGSQASILSMWIIGTSSKVRHWQSGTNRLSKRIGAGI